jgi:hypothetical protein
MLVITMLGLGPLVHGANYYIPTESYKILCFPPGPTDEAGGYIDRMGDMQITHRILIFCFKDHLEEVNVTIPYPVRNWTTLVEFPKEVHQYVTVTTTTALVLDFDAFLFSNQTVLRVKLPELVYAGEDFQFVLVYHVWGAMEPANKTYWDRQLGRGDNWRVGFVPPIHGVPTNGITIDLSMPHGALLKKWGSGSGTKIQYPQSPARVRWQIDQPGILEEFWAIFGEAGVGSSAVILLFSVGVASFVIIFIVALLIRSRYGHQA